VGVCLVAAIGRRGELGRDGGLVFRLKADMAHFREVTRGKPLLMGRRTWESLPKRPLPGRPNLVLTRDAGRLAPGAWMFADLAAALAAGRAMAAARGAGELAVIGGAGVYAATLPFATRLWLTEVEAEADADVFFPAFDRGDWREVSARRIEAGEGDDAPAVIRELVRRGRRLPAASSAA
jgi:dihydrofolate reductase